MRAAIHQASFQRIFFCVAALLLAAAATLSAQPATGASASTVVTAMVPSATRIDPTGCASGVSGKTDFGIVTPGSTVITSLDCSVAFGSSNDTSQLRLRQSDASGRGMWMYSRGAFDASFDGPSGVGNGKFVEPIGPFSDSATSTAVQGDGKIVVAGSCSNLTNDDFCLARYNLDGSRDTSFDGPSGAADGEFLEPIGPGEDRIAALAIQPDGKIVVAGDCGGFCLARYEVDGSRDVSFDGPSGSANGEFIDLIGAATASARSMVLQTDGKIVVAGTCFSGMDYDVCLARYEADGSRDTTFDGPAGTGDGAFLEPIGVNNDSIEALAMQPDGKIVALGICSGAANDDFCLARFNSDGSLDATFDGPSGTANGKFVEPIGPGDDYSASLAVHPDGRIVVAGRCWQGGESFDFCLARFNGDGSRDTTFDGPSGTGDGKFLQPIGPDTDIARSVILQADGKILAGGNCSDGSSWLFCLVRYNTDGSLDQTFDGPSGTADGVVMADIGPSDDQINALAMRSDGKFVAVGDCYGLTNGDICLAAFDQGGNFDDYVTGGGTDRDFASAASTSFFAACLRAVSGGASNTWSIAGACPASDGVTWHALPTTYDKVAQTAALEPDPVDATAHFRFALRAASNQTPGAYVAPIEFDVIAPDA